MDAKTESPDEATEWPAAVADTDELATDTEIVATEAANAAAGCEALAKARIPRPAIA